MANDGTQDPRESYDQAPTTPELDELNPNACYEHQEREVHGDYGQRGCMACVFTKKLLDKEITKARIDELKQIQDLGDGLGHLAKHALTIGVHIDDRIAALQPNIGEKPHE